MKRRLLIFLIILFLLPVVAYSDENFGIRNLEIGTLRFDKWLLDGDTVKYARFPISFDILFYLTEEGCVDSVHVDSLESNAYIRSIYASIINIDFTPTIYNDTAISVVMPARLKFYVERSRIKVALFLPRNIGNFNYDKRLLQDFMRLNGFEPALVKSIPPYFYSSKDYVNKDDYNYGLFWVTVDTSGRPTMVKTVLTNYEHYAGLFSSALRYSEYRPASYEGNKIVSDILVTARFYRRISYPTHKWPPEFVEGEDAVDYSYEYHRISSKPFIGRIINPPMPANLIAGGIVINEPVIFSDSLLIDIRIDTLGNIESSGYAESTSQITKNLADKVLNNLKYIPALDINGNRSAFEGRIMLIFAYDSKNIRVVSEWLLDQY